MANDHRHSHSGSLPSNMMRRFAQLFALLLLLLFMQCHFSILRDSGFITTTLQALGKYKIVKPIQDMKPGPLHVLLLAYARTGSSFVGDLMQSLPNSFYHFEPIHFIKGQVLTDSFNESRDLLGNLFVCNISQVEGLLPWYRKHKNYMKLQRNARYWKECSKINACYNGMYIDNFCRNQTIVIAKTIRLNLLEASKLFSSHPHLNLKIIYLTRDPRGTMNSRMKKPINSWCRRDPMCFNSRRFCAGINADVSTACSLSSSRPENFMVIRYEDISLDPYDVTEQLVKFLGFPSVPNQLREFLKTHTYFAGNIKHHSKAAGLEYHYTTFRNSSYTAMNWRKEIVFKRVVELQDACNRFLKAFGYHFYRTSESLRTNSEMNMKHHGILQSTCNV